MQTHRHLAQTVEIGRAEPRQHADVLRRPPRPFAPAVDGGGALRRRDAGKEAAAPAAVVLLVAVPLRHDGAGIRVFSVQRAAFTGVGLAGPALRGVPAFERSGDQFEGKGEVRARE